MPTQTNIHTHNTLTYKQTFPHTQHNTQTYVHSHTQHTNIHSHTFKHTHLVGVCALDRLPVGVVRPARRQYWAIQARHLIIKQLGAKHLLAFQPATKTFQNFILIQEHSKQIILLNINLDAFKMLSDAERSLKDSFKVALMGLYIKCIKFNPKLSIFSIFVTLSYGHHSHKPRVKF